MNKIYKIKKVFTFFFIIIYLIIIKLLQFVFYNKKI